MATHLALSLLGIAACDSTPPTPPPPPPAVATVLVTPGEILLLAGQTRQLTATTISTKGHTLSGRTVQWETSAPTIATITSSGLVTAIVPGAATITATSEGRRGYAMVTVQQPVARVSVSPSSLVLVPGESRLLLAGALNAADQPVIGLPVIWISSAPQIASVDAAGRVTGLLAGTATVTARIDTASATVAVEVTNPMQVSGIWDWTETVPFCSDTGTYVFTQTGSLVGGTSTQVGACTGPGGPRRNDGSALLETGGVAAITLEFSVRTGPSLCHYTGSADAPTPTRISGTVACTFGSGTWEAIRKTTVGEVRIVPTAATLFSGETQSFAIELTNASGHRIFSRPVTWTSDDDAVATVTATGVVQGKAAGTTQITATVEGVRGSAGVTIGTLSLTTVAAGGNGSCGLTPQGKTYCWGLSPAALTGAPAFTSLSVGAAGGCGLTVDGSAYCWGDNSTGELGVPGVGWSDTPLAVVGGLHFTSLTAGGFVYNDYYYYYSSFVQAHACGLIAGGTAYCWGLNSSGQLGTGTTNDHPMPQLVLGGLNFSALSAGGNHTCGLTPAGTAYCWGSNSQGQLGSGLGSQNLPTAVSAALTFKAITAGTWHTCAITTSGAAYCWGSNDHGQLGDGTFSNTAAPVAVAGGLSFVAIVTGTWHTCALTAAGQAYCWGSNESGNLGAGPRGNTSIPVPVSLGLTFASLATGSWASHTCGITTSSITYCWGNGYGLGAGNIGNSDHPVRVLGQP